MRLELGNRLFAITGLETPEAVVLHQVHEHLTKTRLVVHDEAVLRRV